MVNRNSAEADEFTGTYQGQQIGFLEPVGRKVRRALRRARPATDGRAYTLFGIESSHEED